MTVYCPSLNDFPQLSAHIAYGASDTAGLLEDQLRVGFQHFVEPRLRLLRSEIEEMAADVDGEGGTTLINERTVRAAVEFASLLPRWLPAPEVAPDPDGDISFDWLGRPGWMFSVSVDASGRLAYAGRFGEKSKVHGTEQLAEALPREIIRGIAKATS